MGQPGSVHVRIFGLLRPYCAQRGIPTTTTFEVPAKGITGADLALALELPLDRIEGIFVNHTVHDLGQVILPGDEVAFVPYGTPGPHRVYLGLYQAGKRSHG